MRRLQHSKFSNPSLGRKIFEIIAAAQRPLTLSELAEAISITPGDIVWSQSKLVNDVLKSLQSCGSFIIVDEELSTVRFAHSSVKRHLLSEPTDLDVNEYHIDSSQADRNLGEITVTYLNLDVFSTQLTRTSAPSQHYVANVPAFVVKSAIPKRDAVKRMALTMLKSRRTPVKDSGPNLEKSASLIGENDPQIQQGFSFLPYCQEHWLHHTKYIYFSIERVYTLWERLVDGRVVTVELPWVSKDREEANKRFLSCIIDIRHAALAASVIDYQRPRYISDPNKVDLAQMEQLLGLLPNNYVSRRNLRDPRSDWSSNCLFLEAAARGYGAVVQLCLRKGANVNAQDNGHSSALQNVICSGNKAIAELLIEKGADVNLRGGKYDSALQAAAATQGMDSIVQLLLEKGADVNAQGGVHLNALTAVAANDNVTTMMLLLKGGADVDQEPLYYGTQGPVTPLIIATSKNSPSAVSVLLDAGADPNARGWRCHRPLEIAARERNEQIVKLLLDSGGYVRSDYELSGSAQEIAEELDTTLFIASWIADSR